MATNDFKQLMQHHLNQTRAGLYGQFEHAFNFNEGADQNAALKIGPGENITFSGELLDGQQCTLIATNNLTSTSGAGFAAQGTAANDRIIVIPLKPKLGNATLEFSCQTAGALTEVVSHTISNKGSGLPDRWDAIDENSLRIFSKEGSRCSDVVSSEAGDYYVAGGRVFAGDGRGEMAAFDANGTFKWRGFLEVGDLAVFVAYDEASSVVATAQIGSGDPDGGRGVVKLVSYDASLNVDQGDVGEPEPLYSTQVTGGFRPSALYDMKADGNGSFILAVRRNDNWVTPGSGTFANIFKIDAATGAIVATFDTNSSTGQARIAACPVTGNIAIAPRSPSTPSGQSSMNLLILDSDLNFVASDRIQWGALSGIATPSHVSVAFDETGRVFVVSTEGFMVRYTDSTLTVQDKAVSLFAPTQLPFGRHTTDIGHNHNGNLIVASGGALFNNEQHVLRFDNDGILEFDYLMPSPARIGGGIHVRPASGPGPDLGGFFTQELSGTPPGRKPSVAAVKYAAGNITGIFFNSVEVEFDHSKWTAVHSVNGPVPIGSLSPGWEYNSPL